MRHHAKNVLSLLLALLILLGASACKKAPAPYGVADNDILTFVNNVENRPIIRIGTQYYTPDLSLINALQQHYPDYLFVLDYSAAAGEYSEVALLQGLENGTAPYDLVITGNLSGYAEEKARQFVDLSGEPFLSNYLISSLNDVSVGGRIYNLPGSSTLAGIAFNVDMFKANGWEVPRDQDEFFALCEEIRAAGISPFSTCAKYIGQFHRLLTMTNYWELFGSLEGIERYNAVQRGEAKLAGYFEPVLETGKRFVDAGLITIDDFTASLTKQRQAFWAGEYAMIDYDSAIFSYAEAENAPFELGIMPYPARNAEDSGFAAQAEYYISIPKYVEQDPERLELMKGILAYISTDEGQRAMVSDSLRVSNVKGVDLSDNPAMQYAKDAYDRGNLYPIVTDVGTMGLLQTSVMTFYEGGTVASAIEAMDKGVDAMIAAGAPIDDTPTYEVIATAEADFTMLETTCFIAEALRKASGAELALMVNGSFFRSNLARIEKGDITNNMQRYVMKGMGAEDFLTTYQLTGAQIKKLLEHPIVNGTEIDALIVAAGLAIEYAPWNERGSRVISLKNADGTVMSDDQFYTVAAFPGVIHEDYITDTLRVHDSLGKVTDIMENEFRQSGTIRPDLKGRVKLVWP